MSPVSNHTSPSVGRLTGFFLCLIVMLCLALIGASAYVKLQLDRAQTALVAPSLPQNADEESFDKIRRDLGYGGFLGIAQNFAATHDAGLLPDMKAQLKQAHDGIDHLPEKTDAETRHDLQAIIAGFDTAMQKAEKSNAVAAAPALVAPDFTAVDLLPLYAALPILDSRVATALATDHAAQQNEAETWSNILTVISWGSLMIASALAAGIFLVLRDRNSAPMRALTQSVKNMAAGDMRTAIWGMERQDAIGDLARSVDQARFHFSQLPDMSLLSEHGPVRIKFEGNTRSLFEAMMRVISRDSESVHAQATNLTEAVQKQQEALAHVVERVEAVLVNVENRAVSGDQQVRQALQNMLGSAESLKHAQEHAADQLNRIIPFLQERTQGISEITQIAGKQVAQALQSLTLTERGLKVSAEQSDIAIRKFSTTADTLGERMFGAVNLLQASGKVLAETTETAQTRFDAAIERINAASLQAQPAAAAPADSRTAERLEEAVAALESAHGKLELLMAEQSDAARTQFERINSESIDVLVQTTATAATLSSTAEHLRSEHNHLAELILKLGDQVAQLNLSPAPPAPVAETTSPLLADIKDGFASLEQRMTWLHSQIASLLQKAEAQPAEPATAIDEQMRDHWYQMAGQIEATRSNLAEVIMQQTDRVQAQIAAIASQPPAAKPDPDFARDAQNQMEQQTLILNELVATLALLDAHMQELRVQVQKAG